MQALMSSILLPPTVREMALTLVICAVALMWSQQTTYLSVTTDTNRYNELMTIVHHPTDTTTLYTSTADLLFSTDIMMANFPDFDYSEYLHSQTTTCIMTMSLCTSEYTVSSVDSGGRECRLFRVVAASDDDPTVHDKYADVLQQYDESLYQGNASVQSLSPPLQPKFAMLKTTHSVAYLQKYAGHLRTCLWYAHQHQYDLYVRVAQEHRAASTPFHNTTDLNEALRYMELNDRHAAFARIRATRELLNLPHVRYDYVMYTDMDIHVNMLQFGHIPLTHFVNPQHLRNHRAHECANHNGTFALSDAKMNDVYYVAQGDVNIVSAAWLMRRGAPTNVYLDRVWHEGSKPNSWQHSWDQRPMHHIMNTIVSGMNGVDYKNNCPPQYCEPVTGQWFGDKQLYYTLACNNWGHFMFLPVNYARDPLYPQFHVGAWSIMTPGLFIHNSKWRYRVPVLQNVSTCYNYQRPNDTRFTEVDW